MDWITTFAVIDPDHHQPSGGRGSPDHQIRLPTSNVALNPIRVVKRLLNFRKRDFAFRMIGTEVPTIGGIPDDRPIVHPFSIYKLGGQRVASGI